MRCTFIQDYVEIQALLKTGIELEMCLQKEARCISNVIATFWVEHPVQHVSPMGSGAIQLFQDVVSTQFRKKE